MRGAGSDGLSMGSPRTAPCGSCAGSLIGRKLGWGAHGIWDTQRQQENKNSTLTRTSFGCKIPPVSHIFSSKFLWTFEPCKLQCNLHVTCQGWIELRGCMQGLDLCMYGLRHECIKHCIPASQRALHILTSAEMQFVL